MTTIDPNQAEDPLAPKNDTQYSPGERLKEARLAPGAAANWVPGPQNSPIRIAVIHPDAASRAGLKQLFARATDMKCVAATASGPELWARIGEWGIDLVLVGDDVDRPPVPSNAVWLKEKCPKLRVVAIKAHIDYPDLKATLECGMDGLLFRPFTTVECLSLLRGVMAGASPSNGGPSSNS